MLTLLFVFSATWWKLATDANTYTPSVFFVLLCFYLILPTQKPRPALVAVLHSVGICLHQLAVLFYPAIVLGLYLQAPAPTSKRRLWLILQYSVVAFTITFGAYYYCFYLQSRSLDLAALFSWLTAYARGPESGWSFSVRDSCIGTLRGNVRLFFGGRFNLLRGLISPWVAALLGVLMAVVLTLGFKLTWNLKGLKVLAQLARQRAGRFKPVILLCAVWITVFVVFLFFWTPNYTGYRLFYLPALIILCGVPLAGYEALNARARKWTPVLLVSAVAVSNFLFLVFPYTHADKSPPVRAALEMNGVWRGGTIIYYAKSNTDNRMVSYFNPAATLRQLKPDGLGVPEDELESIYKRGGSAWLEASAIDRISSAPDGLEWLANHSNGQPRYKLDDPGYNIKFMKIAPLLSAAAPAN